MRATESIYFSSKTSTAEYRRQQFSLKTIAISCLKSLV